MPIISDKEICFPHPPGSGGPGTFQSHFEKSIKEAGWRITYAGSSVSPTLIMVVGGTRRLFWLWKMKQKGIPILHRLDGIAWLHRKNFPGLRAFLLAEINNLLYKIIHNWLSDLIIYQSNFVMEWWSRKGNRRKDSYRIIYNGTNLNIFKPPSDIGKSVRIVCIEGTIDYSPFVSMLINDLRDLLPSRMTFELYGNFRNKELVQSIHPDIDYKGFIPRGEVHKVLEGSIYLSLDLHPACPNGVIEALASGAPVVAFDTGSLKELVTSDAGEVINYGSDPWNVGYPDVKSLCASILKVEARYVQYSTAARKLAEERFSLEYMTQVYLQAMEDLTKKQQNEDSTRSITL